MHYLPLPQSFLEALERYPSSRTLVYREADAWKEISSTELLRRVARFSSALADLGVSLLIIAVALIWFHISPGISLITLPLFVLLAICTALGASLWLAALNVHYRDVNHMLPFLTQIWMYATPVIYPSSIVPEPQTM